MMMTGDSDVRFDMSTMVKESVLSITESILVIDKCYL